MITPDLFTYTRAKAAEFRARHYGAPGSNTAAIDVVWDVYHDGWWLGQIARRPYGQTLGQHTWQAYFGGWKSWPERRRKDAAAELWRVREPWEKGPTPAD